MTETTFIDLLASGVTLIVLFAGTIAVAIGCCVSWQKRKNAEWLQFLNALPEAEPSHDLIMARNRLWYQIENYRSTTVDLRRQVASLQSMVEQMRKERDVMTAHRDTLEQERKREWESIDENAVKMMKLIDAVTSTTLEELVRQARERT